LTIHERRPSLRQSIARLRCGQTFVSDDLRATGSARGVVERVTFHNGDTGFCVLRVNARGHRDLATVVGHTPTISPGEWITATSDWLNDRTYGQQFKARFLRASAPSSAESAISDRA
jgi:hypothetical protein